MEKSINLNNIKFYENSRDDFLKVISDGICRACTNPQKAKMKIDYTNPLNCECQCERVEHILKIASDLDIEISKLTNMH